MPLFLHSLKRSGHLEQIHMKVCIVGSRKIASQDDYGSQGWEIFAPNLTIYGFDADTDACGTANENLENRQINWNEKHIPLCLWKSAGKSTLYVTKFPGCSSLYPPSKFYIEHYTGNSELIELVDTLKVETTTLDAFCQLEEIDEIDLIQLHVQGAELGVLEGSASILEKSLLGIITEVEFTEIYTGQPLFGDIDVFLRKQGFTLFDVSNMHRAYHRMPVFSKEHEGSLIGGDAFYFRDLICEDLTTHLKKPENIFKLACIADVLNFTDYALEILVYLTLKYGEDEKYNFADNIIEALAQVANLVQPQDKLGSLPIIEKIRPYSSSYKNLTITQESDVNSTNQYLLHKQGYQCLVLGDYSRAVNIYEKAVDVEHHIKSHYWYLGLLLLLQCQQAEAAATWFIAIADGNEEEVDIWTAELVEVLDAEAKRRDEIRDDDTAWIIRQNIKALAPEYNLDNTNKVKYSYLDEESVIEELINTINIDYKYCVDIAASDGVTMSNTYSLFQKGWSGLAVEYDSSKFAALAAQYIYFHDVHISKVMVTPENVVTLLKAHSVPENFGLLNLDIDGYDFFVLDELLTSFRPSIICAEINESIPPPLKFTVKWDSDYVWENNHFYGQSICQLDILCKKYDYALVNLHYNNAFLIPKEISPLPSLTPEEAYRTGYLERLDRKLKFPWNADVEDIHNLSPETALNYVNNLFAKYQSKFVCCL